MLLTAQSRPDWQRRKLRRRHSRLNSRRSRMQGAILLQTDSRPVREIPVPEAEMLR